MIQYKLIHLSDHAQFMERLNAMAAEGWRVHHFDINTVVVDGEIWDTPTALMAKEVSS
jgi:hypothetical protein